MVSSTCRASCPSMVPIHGTRKLHIDPNKNYQKQLQVETSVEYDLPPHIYPPKGSEPILMIHPAYTPSRGSSRKPIVSSPIVPAASSPNVRNLGKLTSQNRKWCSCGNPSCNNINTSKVVSVRSVQQQGSVLTNKPVPNNQVPDIMVLATSKGVGYSSEQQKSQQEQQRQRSSLHKQLEINKQIKLQLQKAQQQAKLQADQQVQQNLRQLSNKDQFTKLNWSSLGKTCQGPCCQPRIGALPPSQAEFLAPGLPPSLLARTPSRGSPKLRTRTRRGLNVANTVNLPEYLGSTRPSRALSVGGSSVVLGSSHSQHRTRSSTLSTSTPPSITAHQVPSVLDMVRALTPRSLFPSTPNNLQSAINNSATNSLFSVGQSRDSGCSVSASEYSVLSEISFNTSNNSKNSNNNSSKNTDLSWNVVDSGFCTPVDSEDQYMEPLDLNITNPFTPATVLSSSTPIKDSEAWLKQFSQTASITPSSTPISGLYSTFLPPKSAHYIPHNMYNLAY